MYKSKNNRKKTMERTTTKNSRKIQNNCRFCWEAPVQLLVHSLTRARVRLLTFFNRSPTHTSRPWLMTILHTRLGLVRVLKSKRFYHYLQDGSTMNRFGKSGHNLLPRDSYPGLPHSSLFTHSNPQPPFIPYNCAP